MKSRAITFGPFAYGALAIIHGILAAFTALWAFLMFASMHSDWWGVIINLLVFAAAIVMLRNVIIAHGLRHAGDVSKANARLAISVSAWLATAVAFLIFTSRQL